MILKRLNIYRTSLIPSLLVGCALLVIFLLLSAVCTVRAVLFIIGVHVVRPVTTLLVLLGVTLVAGVILLVIILLVIRLLVIILLLLGWSLGIILPVLTV